MSLEAFGQQVQITQRGSSLPIVTMTCQTRTFKNFISTTMTDLGIPKPFKLSVSPETHTWITQRVDTARIISDITHRPGEEWSDGIPSATVSELVEYWRNQYDWRKVEERINSTFEMYTVKLEEAGEVIDLHYVHHRSTREDAVPLIFAHGWPGNFMEVCTSCLHVLTMHRDDCPLHRSSTY